MNPKERLQLENDTVNLLVSRLLGFSVNSGMVGWEALLTIKAPFLMYVLTK